MYMCGWVAGGGGSADAAGFSEFESYLANKTKQSHADVKSDSKSISDEGDMSRSRMCGEETTSAAVAATATTVTTAVLRQGSERKRD